MRKAGYIFKRKEMETIIGLICQVIEVISCSLLPFLRAPVQGDIFR